MTAQDPNVMIAKSCQTYLPLALRLNVTEDNFVSNVKKIIENFWSIISPNWTGIGHKFE
jgi:hypothetical protein